MTASVDAGVDSIEHGLSMTADALTAASRRARAWLGVPAWLSGAPLDVVTYDADPRDDLAVLEHPVAIVIADHRVH